MPSPKHAKLILFKKQPPEEAEVLYEQEEDKNSGSTSNHG